MSIKSEIDRISANIDNTYTALEPLGATMPTDRNSNNLATTVQSIVVAPLDTTLSQPGQAAEAAAVGRRFAEFQAITNDEIDTICGTIFHDEKEVIY